MPDNQVIPSIALGNHSFRTRLQMLFLLIMTLSARAYLRNADLQQVHSYSLILADGEWFRARHRRIPLRTYSPRWAMPG